MSKMQQNTPLQRYTLAEHNSNSATQHQYHALASLGLKLGVQEGLVLQS